MNFELNLSHRSTEFDNTAEIASLISIPKRTRILRYFDLFLFLAHKCNLYRMRTNTSVICLEAEQPRWSRLNADVYRPHVLLAHSYRRYQMQKARSGKMRMANKLVTIGYAGLGNKTVLHNWLRMLKNLPPGTHEIYCHPAYPDDTLHRWSCYSNERAQELAIVRRKELLQLGADCRRGDSKLRRDLKERLYSVSENDRIQD